MADPFKLMNAAANMYGSGNTLQDPTAGASQMPQGDPQLDAVLNQPNSSPVNPEDANNPQYQDAAQQATSENQARNAPAPADTSGGPKHYAPGMAGVRQMQSSVFKNPYSL